MSSSYQWTEPHSAGSPSVLRYKSQCLVYDNTTFLRVWCPRTSYNVWRCKGAETCHGWVASENWSLCFTCCCHLASIGSLVRWQFLFSLMSQPLLCALESQLAPKLFISMGSIKRYQYDPHSWPLSLSAFSLPCSFGLVGKWKHKSSDALESSFLFWLFDYAVEENWCYVRGHWKKSSRKTLDLIIYLKL